MRALTGKRAQEVLGRKEGLRMSTAAELSFKLPDALIAVEVDGSDALILEVTYDDKDETERMLEIEPRTPDLVYVFYREPATSCEAMDEGPRVEFWLTPDTPCLVFK